MFSNSCKAQQDSTLDIVALIGTDDTVRFAELQKYTGDRLYTIIFKHNPREGYEKGLREIVERRLKVRDFFERGLEKRKDLLQNIRRTINEELLVQYYNTKFYSKYINEASLQKTYDDMGKVVLARKIVLLKPVNSSKKKIDFLRARANTLKKTIENGANITSLVKKYSQDTASSRHEGYIPLISWKESQSNYLNKTIFNIPLNEVRILEDTHALSIVKVVEISKQENIPPISQIRGEILKILEERYTDVSLKDFDETKEKLVDEKSTKWNEEGLQQILAWSNMRGFYPNKYADTLKNALLNGNNFLIADYSNGKVDVQEYLRLLNDILIIGKSGSLGEGDLKKFILEALRTDRIVRAASALGMEKEILHPRTKNPIIRDELVRLYNQEVIETQIPQATDSVLHQFYAANKDTLYYQLQKVNLYVIPSSEKRTIDSLKAKLAQNIPFEKLVHEVFVKTFIRDREGIIKSYLSNEEPFLGETAFRLRINETAGPIEYNDPAKGKQYALVKCIHIREEKQLLYQDVEKTIAGDYIASIRQKVADAVLEQLKKKYGAVLFPDVLKQKLALPANEPK